MVTFYLIWIFISEEEKFEDTKEVIGSRNQEIQTLQ